jgi:MoxR-like ATPase
VDGFTHKLDEPFMVIATQNPIEHEGTYPLPESQLDRFIMRLSMGYPSREAELEVLERHGDHSGLDDLEPIADATSISILIKMAREVHVAEPLKRYIVELCESTRGHSDVYLGASPRASLYLLKAARVRAATEARDYVIPDDLKAITPPVLSHRILLSPEAQMRGTTSEDVLADVMERVPVPAPRG